MSKRRKRDERMLWVNSYTRHRACVYEWRPFQDRRYATSIAEREKKYVLKNVRSLLVITTNAHAHKGQSHSPNVWDSPQIVASNQTKFFVRNKSDAT